MLTLADQGGRGVSPPFLADIICEQLTQVRKTYRSRERTCRSIVNMGKFVSLDKQRKELLESPVPC